MTDKSRKKVLYIITKSVWGGAGKYVYDLATNLPKERWEVFVAAGPADGGTGGKNELAKKLIDAGIPYFEIKNFQRDTNILKDIFAYFEIFFLLFKIRPDIIHVNSSKAGGIVGIAAFDYRFLGLKFNLKTIFTAHGWAFHENRPWWHILLIKLFTKITCFYYGKIICVSEYDRLSTLENHIAPKRKLITIHNGIDIQNYKFLSKEEARKNIYEGPTFGRSAERAKSDIMQEFWVGTVGEYTKNKGQEYLIDAIKKINKKYQLKTILIGWGEEKSNLKSQISNLKLENEIFLIDNLPDAASYLKAFDIFVLPSLKEGLPYTLLEAGLAGLPVVTTNVGGIPEIIGHNEGILIKSADSDTLAYKIEELMENTEKRGKIAANLQQKIIREFSFEKILNVTLSTYE